MGLWVEDLHELQPKLLKGGLYKETIYRTTIGVIKGDTRSLDNGTYRVWGLGFQVQGLVFRV